jgi:DNA-binding transcriptional ArsR family regulator
MPRHKTNHLQIGSHDKSYLAAADFFLSFSSPISLMILSGVRKQEMASGDIAEKFGIEPKTVLFTLNAMERQGILSSRVRSQKTLYRVADPEILRAFDRILQSPAKNLEKLGSSQCVT